MKNPLNLNSFKMIIMKSIIEDVKHAFFSAGINEVIVELISIEWQKRGHV